MVSLETTFLVDLLREDAVAVTKAELLEEAAEPKFVAPPAAAEILSGAHMIGGKHLERSRELLESLILLPMDMEACDEAGRIAADLSSRGKALGSMDLLIAAVSKRHGQPLLTRDRVYAQVRGLVVETY